MIENRIKVEGNEVDLNDIDVSAITDMSLLFSWIDFNGDISGWMYQMLQMRMICLMNAQ